MTRYEKIYSRTKSRSSCPETSARDSPNLNTNLNLNPNLLICSSSQYPRPCAAECLYTLWSDRSPSPAVANPKV